MKQLFIVSCAFLLSISLNVSATVISYNGYTHDDTTNIVTGSGLDWLQWDYTVGLSISEALSTVALSYDGGGWRLASNVDMANLFNSFVFGASFIWDADENTEQSTTNNDGMTESATDPELVFIDMFGINYFNNINYRYNNPRQITRALFGYDDDNDNRINAAWVEDDAAPTGYAGFYTRYGEVILDNDAYSIGWNSSDMGVALVRESQPIPEPGFLLIFGMVILLVKQITKGIFSF